MASTTQRTFRPSPGRSAHARAPRPPRSRSKLWTSLVAVAVHVPFALAAVSCTDEPESQAPDATCTGQACTADMGAAASAADPPRTSADAGSGGPSGSTTTRSQQAGAGAGLATSAAGSAGVSASSASGATQAETTTSTAGQPAQAGDSAAGGASEAPSTGCDGAPAELHNITPVELEAMLAAKDFALINVHIPYAGEIEGTDANIPYTDIEGLEAHLHNDHAAKAVLYCRSGSMSLDASTKLVERGYCQIYDMPGGMNAWTAAGFTLVDK